MKRNERVQLFFPEKSLTRQEFKDECDLGKILRRFRDNSDGLMELLQKGSPLRYEDVSDFPDYRGALDQVNGAKAKFEALPTIIKQRFGNDPAHFVDFCRNPQNLEELRKLGLAKPVEPLKAASIGETPAKASGTEA